MSMFQMKIPLVVIQILSHLLQCNSVEQSYPTKNHKILYHFTPKNEYTKAVFCSRAGRANGKTLDDLIYKIVIIDQQYL